MYRVRKVEVSQELCEHHAQTCLATPATDFGRQLRHRYVKHFAAVPTADLLRTPTWRDAAGHGGPSQLRAFVKVSNGIRESRVVADNPIPEAQFFAGSETKRRRVGPMR